MTDHAPTGDRTDGLRDRLAAALRTVGLARNLAAYRDTVLPVVEAETANLRAALQARIEDHAMIARLVGERLGLASPLPAVTSIGCVQAFAAHVDEETAALRQRAEKAERERDAAKADAEHLDDLLITERAITRQHQLRGDHAVAAVRRVRHELGEMCDYMAGWTDEHEAEVTAHEIQTMRTAAKEIRRILTVLDRPKEAPCPHEAAKKLDHETRAALEAGEFSTWALHTARIIIPRTEPEETPRCSCDDDPIECSHEAARGEAEAAVERVRVLARVWAHAREGDVLAVAARQILAALNQPEEAANETRAQIAAALPDLIRVAAYVSRGRSHVGVEPYPDASARRALGALDDATIHGVLDRPEGT